jgi:hypothetical protein
LTPIPRIKEIESIQFEEETMRVRKTVVGKALLFVVLGPTLCVILQGSVVKAKGPVTRPFTITGQVTCLDVISEPPWTCLDQGVSSQGGAYSNVSKYTSLTEGFGISFTASGDQIFWVTTGGTVTFTGGTGRFEGAYGEFTPTVSSPDVVPGPSGTFSLVQTYTGKGTITY